MKPVAKKTQKHKILEHLKDPNKRYITSWEAITEYRITRLGAYIKFLKEDGYIIDSENVTQDGKTFSKYWLRNIDQVCDRFDPVIEKKDLKEKVQESLFNDEPETKNPYEGGY